MFIFSTPPLPITLYGFIVYVENQVMILLLVKIEWERVKAVAYRYF